MSISVLDVNSRYSDQSDLVTFPAESSTPLLYVEDKIQISRQDLAANAHAQGHLAEVVFFSFGNLHELLSDAKVYLSGGSKVPDNLVLNSKVASASLGRAGRHLELSRPAFELKP